MYIYAYAGGNHEPKCRGQLLVLRNYDSQLLREAIVGRESRNLFSLCLLVDLAPFSRIKRSRVFNTILSIVIETRFLGVGKMKLWEASSDTTWYGEAPEVGNCPELLRHGQSLVWG